MGRVCKTCAHPERPAIERALVCGDSNRSIAARYGLSEASVRRHKADHLPEEMTKAADSERVADAEGLLQQVQELQAATLRVLQRAEDGGDMRTATLAVREARGNLELLARMVAAAIAFERQSEPRVTIEAVDAEIARLEAELENRVVVYLPDNGRGDRELGRGIPPG